MRNPHDEQYADLVSRILAIGTKKLDRTGTGTYSLFGEMMKFDLSEGFPLLTLKHTPFRWVAEELLWFIAGDRGDGSRNLNEHYLRMKGVDIWQPWAASDGSLGPVYGVQWRSWPRAWVDDGDQFRRGVPIDQIKDLQKTLRLKPDDRRMIVLAWNPGEIEDMALPPCHLMFQCFSRPDEQDPRFRRLDLQMYQRSCDMFLGVPFNIASYALLTHLLAHCTGHLPGVFTWVGGDCHVYTNHVDQAKEMVKREPLPTPLLHIKSEPADLDYYTYEDLDLREYQSHGKLKGDVAV